MRKPRDSLKPVAYTDLKRALTGAKGSTHRRSGSQRLLQGPPPFSARAAIRHCEISTWSTRREPRVTARGASRYCDPASGQCEGGQSFVRGQLGVVERPATRRGDTRQLVVHGPPLVGAGTISGQREGRHYSVQGVPLVIASPATYQCGTRQFVDPRVLLRQNDLFRDRAGLATIGGSPRTESVLPFAQSGAVSHFFGAPLSAMPCGSYHRLVHRSREWRHPADEARCPARLRSIPTEHETCILMRDVEEVLVGKPHLTLPILFTSRPGKVIPRDELIDTGCGTR